MNPFCFSVRFTCWRRGFLFALFILPFVLAASGETFQLERVASGLTFPTCVMQAPGDTNSLYIAENIVTNAAGPLVGRILKYDLVTHSTSVFLDLSGLAAGNAINGLQQFTFHPGYASNGKFYVTYLFKTGSTITGRLVEYKVIAGTPVLQRTNLEHALNNGHAIDMPFFKPGDSSNYLYLTIGDGGPEASSTGYTANRAQDLGTNYGKLLRIDVSDGVDSYPSDSKKNFGIPPANTSITNPPGRLGEVIASGFRNPWRASFDALNGDLYIGDNGFHTAEEVDFIKENIFYPTSVIIPDHGWPATEGTFHPVPGANAFVTNLPVNPASFFPIICRTHTNNLPPGVTADGDNSVIGGCVYRGPIAELNGKYIYGDYTAGRIYTCAFDRNTSSSLFHGTNVTGLTEISSRLEATLPGAVLDSPVSFYTDATGDLYIVNYGLAAGVGVVFKLVAATPVLDQIQLGLGGFSFVVNGAAGEKYAVESSTDLFNWTQVTTNASPFTNVDAQPGNFQRRFFRARFLPP